MKRLLLIILPVLAFACNRKDKKTSIPVEDSLVVKKDTLQPTKVQRETIDSNSLYAIATNILTILKNKHYDSLVQYFHPDGIRFVPYTYIDTGVDRMLLKDEFADLYRKKKKIDWNTDMSGETSKPLTLDQYFRRFVYDVDFLQAPLRSINRHGNSGTDVNNIEEVFPRANTVEYFFPGFKEEMGGMDFRGLNLVFRLYQSKPLLVAIIHNEWTP
ncbi:MAG TPA: hypothetical protein VGO58_06545 [Chitinophagaceae bacterium]|jgi:hypothetical protein|nr:hypothetical protein [Chitinophagaceae bacterium]